jgi:hypothetical protein
MVFEQLLCGSVIRQLQYDNSERLQIPTPSHKKFEATLEF